MLAFSTDPGHRDVASQRAACLLIRLPDRSGCTRHVPFVGRLLKIATAVAVFSAIGASPLSGSFALHAGVLVPIDRGEAGLVGDVKTVVTVESLIKETESYDVVGRLLQRVQEPAGGHSGLGRIAVTSEYDSAGLKRSDTIRDHAGESIKRTAYVHDDRRRRVAEVTAWADGAFVNASFYEYDDKGRCIGELHFNAPGLINRNVYQYDEQGRAVGETYSRNYVYEGESAQLLQFREPTAGYHVTVRYNARGLIAEKIMHDLYGVHESRSEFDYDAHRQQIEERMYDRNNRMIGRKRYEYLYDPQGNWIRETLRWWTFTAGRPHLKQSQTRQRVITYFP
jgi:hypothetical protein